MSQWRRIVLERVPTCKRSIENADNAMAMWIELHFELEKAYEREPPQEDIIHQVYKHAFWCLDRSQNADMIMAVVRAFFEHLPTHGQVSRDLPNWISREDFSKLEPTFRSFLDEDEFKKFKDQFLAGKGRQRKA